MSCEAQFSYSSNEDRPSEIQFIDESDGNITKWEWDFGDVEQGGSFSDEQNPTHDFPANGSYEVNLSILTDNCAHDITKTIEIDVPLDIDFTFYLDSNNVVPNTFVFDAEINGYYDMLSWNFNNQTITDKEDTTHVYPEQDTDYQVCLTAIYTFNDTSEIKEVLCKGLTTSQYYNIGGQVFFGDSLMNNPYDTGDSAVAYLYRIDGPRMTLIDSNYFAYLGYYWFAQKLKAYYIIKTALFENATHFDDYAPTYVGNTTTWEEAEIINLAQNKYREDIHLVEKYTTKEGLSNLQGSIYDLMVSYKPSQQAVVCLYDMESNLVAYQYVDQYGDYYFESLNPGHYMLQADVTGIDARPKLIYLDTKEHQEYKSVKFQEQSELFPNPARHYSILNFDNVQNESALYISVYAVDGQLLGEENSPLSEGMNYLKINLDNYPNGVLILQISDGKQVISKKLFHQKL
ncbi:MAG: hypothetical protein B7C24_07020 [Bacteroidetes bacterium 4572_77]|nr:MAG: hypothetical protein B7C24_07020 [Bacteroidetes bacterium 4572_77]